jgi:hypothetical protein
VGKHEPTLASGQVRRDVCIPERHLEAPTKPKPRSGRPIHAPTLRPRLTADK